MGSLQSWSWLLSRSIICWLSCTLLVFSTLPSPPSRVLLSGSVPRESTLWGFLIYFFLQGGVLFQVFLEGKVRGFLSLVGSEVEGEGDCSLVKAPMSQIFILAWQVFPLCFYCGSGILC